MMIPVQGEAPHGTHHLHHADWRLYWPLIQVCAQHLDNKQAVKDPTVSDFNRTFYFRLIMTRAVSEYINEIAAAGGPDTDLAPQFVRAAEANLDLAWLVHWLYDGAFLVLQWKQSVRSNDSHTLDLLWREFLSLAKTSQAHKTHYAPMAVPSRLLGHGHDAQALGALPQHPHPTHGRAAWHLRRLGTFASTAASPPLPAPAPAPRVLALLPLCTHARRARVGRPGLARQQRSRSCTASANQLQQQRTTNAPRSPAPRPAFHVPSHGL